MYLNQGRDEILEGINRGIAREKEMEFMRPSTKLFFACLMLISVVMIIIGVSMISNQVSRENEINDKHEKIEEELQKQINLLSEQLKDAQNTISEQEEKIKKLETAAKEKDKEIKNLNSSNKELNTRATNAEAQVTTLSTDLTNLSNEYNQLDEKYQKLYEREELYDKYEYALFYNDERTELTYDMCKYGENLMLGYGLDPDLLFSIGMTESEYTENCKNPDSTATGFHQFLKGTGKWVYEELGYTEEYDHVEVQTNGYMSIECAAWYLNHLYKTRNQDIMKVIEGYRGIKNPVSYINRMNRFLSGKNKTLDDIAVTTLALYSAVN